MWKLFPGVPRICWECGKDLKIKDVGEHRTLYPSRETQFLCRDCQRRKVQAFVEETRRGLGLET